MNYHHQTRETEIDLVPLAQFSERHCAGWKMVKGYPLQPGDYAVMMQPPGFPQPRSNKKRAGEHVSKVNSARHMERRTRSEVE